MNTRENPYQILGIHTGASEPDIKKAYRNLVKKVHPDKGGSEEEFKRINGAYTQIMKNEDSVEDSFEDLPDINELFGLFGNLGLFENFGRKPKGPTIKTKINLTLEELETGGKFAITYKRNVPSGKYTNSFINTPFGVVNNIIPEEIEKIFEVYVDIPKCAESKTPLVFPRLAKADDLSPGDLELTIHVIKHPVFSRVSGTLDLQTELEITLKESLTGFDKEIKLLNSEEVVKIECRSIVNPYDMKRIQNYGMQLNESTCGDLLIKFRIAFPVLITDEIANIIKGLDL